ncbi:hexokinase [Treponema sp.]|uniref:hexokinase n=1 Tax=Treponema sp. TaxID=166 RepID=UPI003EFD84AA
MNQKVAAFLGRHNFNIHQDMNPVIEAMLFDMHEGLCGRPSGEDMIKNYKTLPTTTAAGKSVIVIDAGGTNFRSCLVTFDSNGNPSIDFMEKTSMPGIERELSKKEFFDQIAQNLEHLKDKSANIGFCFSYPVEMQEDGDGVLINFSKEVKAPDVEGCHIAKELEKSLKSHGWKNDLRISMLNDTVSALLAGAADPDEGMRYSSYIGFILGTGLNSAYIQKTSPEYKNMKTQIINCESGKFDKISRSDFDIALDKKSTKPGTGIMEKLCSGAYMGPLSFEAITAAGKENLFSEKLSKELSSLDSLTQIEMDSFLHAPYSTKSKLGSIMARSAKDDDYDILFQLLDALVERSARLAAAILSACVIKSGEGKTADRPVCILCNGTSFFKTYKVRQRVIGYLEELLVKERGLFFDAISRENDITLGTAIGGLL